MRFFYEPKALQKMIDADIKILRQKLRRSPSKSELLDHLFSRNRNDPEAKYLERRLDPWIQKSLSPKQKKHWDRF